MVHWTEGLHCCNERWEAAYRRFETPGEEMAKFRKRLIELGAREWPVEACIVDLFCGSGLNLNVLEQLGFTNLKGVDLSPHLLAQYEGHAELYVGDARDLKLEPESVDILIVQGGLHHLPNIPADLEATLDQVQRVLKPDGKFVMVEPWLDPFLRVAHGCCRVPLLRRAWGKLDALAIMIEEEIETYRQWLGAPKQILEALHERFEPEIEKVKGGKILFRGKPRA